MHRVLEVSRSINTLINIHIIFAIILTEPHAEAGPPPTPPSPQKWSQAREAVAVPAGGTPGPPVGEAEEGVLPVIPLPAPSSPPSSQHLGPGDPPLPPRHLPARRLSNTALDASQDSFSAFQMNQRDRHRPPPPEENILRGSFSARGVVIVASFSS
nr:uncharacterized protein LOC132779428 [Anolis sagrei ordinatus]